MSQQHAERLADIAARIEQFLEIQWSRLETVWEQLEQAVERQTAFDEEVRALREEQAQHRERMAREADEILTAWARLEEAERAHSSQPESYRSHGVQLPAVEPAPDVAPLEPSRQSAVEVFQQLRREFGSHADELIPPMDPIELVDRFTAVLEET